ncbi:hypothetical protein XHC_2629 [Xanthomonas hortorum pv. carotae str. M081]|nr:hypothetical protein XHC_2629 [Xanthomonas hortorum pv. carotae str. M081]
MAGTTEPSPDCWNQRASHPSGERLPRSCHRSHRADASSHFRAANKRSERSLGGCGRRAGTGV